MRKSFITLATAFGVLAITSVSSAAILTQTIPFPNTPLNVSNYTESFDQFDPMLGTLESVSISYNLSWGGVGGAELLTGNAANVNLSISFNISLDVASGQFIASESQNGSETAFLNEFDSVIDLDGSSGFSFFLSDTASDSVLLTDASDLAAFIGTGTHNVVLNGVFNAIGVYQGSGPHFLVLSTDGDIEGDVTIAYNYSESTVIPSPAAVWAGLSLIGMAVMRRRDRKQQ